jgi:hypothetical protein
MSSSCWNRMEARIRFSNFRIAGYSFETSTCTPNSDVLTGSETQ